MPTERVVIVADSHFDEHSRFDECVRLHTWIAEDADARGVTLTLHAGDVYERKSTPRERLAAAAWIQRMATLGPVVVARGNHDAVDDLPLLAELETAHRVRVVETAGVLTPSGSRITVGVLGWPQRSRIHAILAAHGLDAGREMTEAAARDALRAVIAGLGAEMQQYSGPSVLLAHAMVRGSVTSTGQPLVGCDMELGLEDLALAKADLYALGHIHKGQHWDVAGAPAVYPGSPRRANFGELEPKGYVVAEFDDRRLLGWEFVEAPATPMVHIEAQWYDEHIGLPGGLDASIDSGAGAEVRLRYLVPSDQRESARAAALELRDKLLAAGALAVKLEEEVLTEQRSRSPEVAEATTLADKLDAYWASKGFDPGERRETLLGKVHEVEATA